MSSTLRTDRSARRAFSRDAARQFARPGTNTATVLDVAAVVHARHPMPHRIVTPKSGKLRINTKRNARAAFWVEQENRVLATSPWMSINDCRASIGLHRLVILPEMRVAQ